MDDAGIGRANERSKEKEKTIGESSFCVLILEFINTTSITVDSQANATETRCRRCRKRPQGWSWQGLAPCRRVIPADAASWPMCLCCTS